MKKIIFATLVPLCNPVVAQPAIIAQPITVTAPTKVISGPSGPITISISTTIPVGSTGSAAPLTQMPPSTKFEINGAALMSRRDGTSELRLSPTSNETVGGNGRDGAFRLSCIASHMGYFDPIVYPGINRTSHLHTFFGNSDQNFDTDPETLSTSATRGTCTGGIANLSSYWVPSTIDITTGIPLVPEAVSVYYKTGVYFDSADGRGAQALPVVSPPAGLRMIAGEPMNAGYSQGTQTNAGVTRELQTRRYDCLIPASIRPPNGTILNGADLQFSEPCPNGSEIWQLVFFPTCWDGVNLDSPDHKSHMAYVVDVPNNQQLCPPTHPLIIPVIQYNIIYRVHAGSRPENWRLSSDLYDLSIPGGRSLHGDWNNGWKQEFLDAIVNNCINAHVDCHNNLLGDGRSLF